MAAVNGVSVGIGATMLLAMDIKVVSQKTKFIFPFARRGIVFDGAASFFMPRIIGMNRTQEWLLRGAPITPEEALAVRKKIWMNLVLVEAGLARRPHTLPEFVLHCFAP